MFKYSVLLLLICLQFAGCDRDDNLIFLDKDTLPLKSKIIIDGFHGCEAGRLYKLIIYQNKSKVRIKLEGLKTILKEYPVKEEDFKELWAALCDAHNGSLKGSYGEPKTTADFRGKFSINIKTKEGKLFQEANLIYGIIKDEKFNNVMNKIMEIVPPEHRLWEYSITSIDYSKLPQESYFSINRIDRNETHGLSVLTVSQKDADCRARLNSNMLCREYEIDLEDYKKFWNQCSAINLTSLKEPTETIRNENGIDEFFRIMIITNEGKYSKDHIVFDQQPNLQLLYNNIIELVPVARSDWE